MIRSQQCPLTAGIPTLQFAGMMSVDLQRMCRRPAFRRGVDRQGSPQGGFQPQALRRKIVKKPAEQKSGEDLMREALRSLKALGLSTVIVVGAGAGLLQAQEKSDPN